MEYIEYPIIHYRLDDQHVLGILVGSGVSYEVIESDLKNVKMALTSYLQRRYKKYDDYPSIAMENPRLKTFEVKVRPVYRMEGRSFPSASVFKVPMPAVYGESPSGYYECFLPLLEQSFYYYEPRTLASLVQNMTMQELHNKLPEEIYRYIIHQPAELDTVTLKINPRRQYKFSNNWTGRQFETLRSMAEPYPYNKSIRRNISIFPEAAWELEDKVDMVIERIIQNRTNVLLVGNHGVGKSAVLRQGMKKITSRYSSLNLTFWQLIAQRIIAQAKYLGEWQQNVEDLVEDLQAAQGVLWVIDVMQLLMSGGGGAEDSIAAFMMHYLKTNQLQIIGEVTPMQLDMMRRLLPGFVESFQLVHIEELPEHRIQSILAKFSEFCGQNLKIKVKRESQELAYRLLLRYYPYESFPGKAIKFLSQCVNHARIEGLKEIDKQAVIQNFIEQSGMPELFLRDDILLDSDELRKFFTDRIIGQDAAIDTLCSVVKIFKAGLNNPHKPISTMIFAGPTGVGKTASTKALAEYFFGKGQKRSPLIRIDMSEFQHAGHLARFIGAGGEVGKLVQEVRERPFSVLLLDEIEKADSSIFDALLTVLDEGILVDAFGRVTNFRNTIIIMTSNLGASSRPAVQLGNTVNTNYESAIAKFFRPEFVNRLDYVVTFDALKAEHIRSITYIELNSLKKREGFEKKGLGLDFSEALVEHLAQVGFDERYGARPLQRAVENEVVSPLAKWLLEHPDVENTLLYIDYDQVKGLTIKQ